MWQQPRCSQSSGTSGQLLINLSRLWEAPGALQGARLQRFARCVCVMLNSSLPLCHAGLWLTNPLQTKLPGSVVVMQILCSYFRRVIPLAVLLLLLSRSDTANLHWLAVLCLEMATQLILAWSKKLRTLHLQMFAAECAEQEAICRIRQS